MGFFKDMAKKQTAFEVIGGQNYFNKAMANMYKMVEEKNEGEGIVTIQKKLYYFLGINKNISHERSAGKTGAGAVIGTVLAPGIGTIIGGAIGAKKKDTSTFFLDFADYETKQKFTVQVKPIKNTTDISSFRVSNIRIEDDSVTSSADELLKFKALLDADAITQEEFDAKKKELLGL